ncbi:MAG: hypothetical protein ACRD2G_07230, partial [Terriglobia bacterium]
MKRYQLAAFVLGCSLIFATAPVLSASRKKKQQQAGELFKRAQDISNLQVKGNPPFVLDASVMVYLSDGSKDQDEYYLTWLSETKWRKEISFPDYHRDSIRSGDEITTTSNLNYVPFRVFQIENTFCALWGCVGRTGIGKAAGIENHKINGSPAECVSFREKGNSASRDCFDLAKGYLVRRDSAIGFVITDSDYQAAGSKEFPRTITVLQGGHVVDLIKVTHLTINPSLS